MSKCNVCSRERETHVVCCGFGPASFAYCVECLEKPAEPVGVFHYLYDHVSNKGKGLDESVNQWFTWVDGAYVSWPEFVERKRQHDS